MPALDHYYIIIKGVLEAQVAAFYSSINFTLFFFLLVCFLQDAAVWSIKQFNGSQEYLMRAHFGLPSISAEDAREWKAPIQVYQPASHPPPLIHYFLCVCVLVFVLQYWPLYSAGWVGPVTR